MQLIPVFMHHLSPHHQCKVCPPMLKTGGQTLCFCLQSLSPYPGFCTSFVPTLPMQSLSPNIKNRGDKLCVCVCKVCPLAPVFAHLWPHIANAKFVPQCQKQGEQTLHCPPFVVLVSAFACWCGGWDSWWQPTHELTDEMGE